VARTPTIRGELPDKFQGLTAAQLRDYLKCRRHLHAWGDDERYTIVRNKRTRRQQIRLVLQCDRCDSIRIEMMTIATGDRIGTPNYIYSEGYQLARGERFTAADRSALRLYAAAKAKNVYVEEEE
jgi:hypothetical protein